MVLGNTIPRHSSAGRFLAGQEQAREKPAADYADNADGQDKRREREIEEKRD